MQSQDHDFSSELVVWKNSAGQPYAVMGGVRMLAENYTPCDVAKRVDADGGAKDMLVGSVGFIHERDLASTVVQVVR